MIVKTLIIGAELACVVAGGCVAATPRVAGPREGTASTTVTVQEIGGQGSSPAEVVRRLYRDFPPNGGRSIQTQPLRVLADYLTPNLARLLAADQECGKQGEVCRLDFGIMDGTQGGTIADLQVCDPMAGPGWVEVRFTVNGEDNKIEYRVERVGTNWRVADIKYWDRDGQFTLVGALSKKQVPCAGAGLAPPGSQGARQTIPPLETLQEGLDATLDGFKKVEIPVARRGSTEGGVWEVYTDSRGFARAIVRVDHGETGKIETRWVSQGGKSFAIRRRVVEYKQPIYLDPRAEVRHESTTDYYSCDGTWYVPVRKGHAEDASEALAKAEEMAEVFAGANELRPYLPPRTK